MLGTFQTFHAEPSKPVSGPMASPLPVCTPVAPSLDRSESDCGFLSLRTGITWTVVQALTTVHTFHASTPWSILCLHNAVSCFLLVPLQMPHPHSVSSNMPAAPGRPQASNVVKDDLGLLILPHLPPMCWHYRHALLCPIWTVMRMSPGLHAYWASTIFCLHFTSAGVTGVHGHMWLFTWVWRI